MKRELEEKEGNGELPDKRKRTERCEYAQIGVFESDLVIPILERCTDGAAFMFSCTCVKARHVWKSEHENGSFCNRLSAFALDCWNHGSLSITREYAYVRYLTNRALKECGLDALDWISKGDPENRCTGRFFHYVIDSGSRLINDSRIVKRISVATDIAHPDSFRHRSKNFTVLDLTRTDAFLGKLENVKRNLETLGVPDYAPTSPSPDNDGTEGRYYAGVRSRVLPQEGEKPTAENLRTKKLHAYREAMVAAVIGDKKEVVDWLYGTYGQKSLVLDSPTITRLFSDKGYSYLIEDAIGKGYDVGSSAFGQNEAHVFAVLAGSLELKSLEPMGDRIVEMLREQRARAGDVVAAGRRVVRRTTEDLDTAGCDDISEEEDFEEAPDACSRFYFGDGDGDGDGLGTRGEGTDSFLKDAWFHVCNSNRKVEEKIEKMKWLMFEVINPATKETLDEIDSDGLNREISRYYSNTARERAGSAGNARKKPPCVERLEELSDVGRCSIVLARSDGSNQQNDVLSRRRMKYYFQTYEAVQRRVFIDIASMFEVVSDRTISQQQQRRQQQQHLNHDYIFDDLAFDRETCVKYENYATTRGPKGRSIIDCAEFGGPEIFSGKLETNHEEENDAWMKWMGIGELPGGSRDADNEVVMDGTIRSHGDMWRNVRACVNASFVKRGYRHSIVHTEGTKKWFRYNSAVFELFQLICDGDVKGLGVFQREKGVSLLADASKLTTEIEHWNPEHRMVRCLAFLVGNSNTSLNAIKWLWENGYGKYFEPTGKKIGDYGFPEFPVESDYVFAALRSAICGSSEDAALFLKEKLGFKMMEILGLEIHDVVRNEGTRESRGVLRLASSDRTVFVIRETNASLLQMRAKNGFDNVPYAESFYGGSSTSDFSIAETIRLLLSIEGTEHFEAMRERDETRVLKFAWDALIRESICYHRPDVARWAIEKKIFKNKEDLARLISSCIGDKRYRCLASFSGERRSASVPKNDSISNAIDAVDAIGDDREIVIEFKIEENRGETLGLRNQVKRTLRALYDYGELTFGAGSMEGLK
jgi:hypothetical protein